MPSASPVNIPRHELLAMALQLGVARPESLTQEQLLDTIRRTSEGEELPPEPKLPATGGWLLVARHLVARVVEEGLNMPGAARLIGGRSADARSVHPRHRAPLPTFTLARIYLAQGYPARARTTLQAVIEREPENSKARALWDELTASDAAEALEPTARETPAPIVPLAGPQRDGVVILRRDNQAHVYWELASGSAVRLHSGPLKLLICSFQPSPDGAQERQVEVDVTAPVGMYTLTCTSSSELRAVIGAPSAEAATLPLLPLCVASLRSVGPSGEMTLEFTPRAGLYELPVAERALQRLR